jgi:PTH1 family peptidyl-tRNA hydrolase
VFIVAGLGNPGPKYRGNRHNVGFMVVDAAVGRDANGAFKSKFQAEFCLSGFAEEKVAYLKPMTFMNLSGMAVGSALSFFRLPLSSLIVVHDELDLEFGACRVKLGGGTAGHKGLRSIVEQCGGEDFARVRVGIGRPEAVEVEDYVLSDFSASERQRLPDVVDTAVAALHHIVERGAQDAMNRFNVRDGGGPQTDA